MPRPSPRPFVLILLTGLLLGAGLVFLPIDWRPPEGQGPRIVVGGPELEALRQTIQARQGRSPAEAELNLQLEQHLRSEVLYREAVSRGYEALPGSDERDSMVRRMERLAAARWIGPPPTPDEIQAYFGLRRDRYSEVAPPGPMPPDVGLTPDADPRWAEVSRRVAADIGTEAAAASADQFLRELAPRYRFVLSREVRSLRDGEARATREVIELLPVTDAVFSSDSMIEQEGIAYLEELGSGEFDLVLLHPPGTTLELTLPGRCSSTPDGLPREIVSHPSGPGSAVMSDAPGSTEPWRVERRSATCPDGVMEGDRFEAQGSGPVQLELHTLDGRTLTSLLTPSSPDLVVPPAPGGWGLIGDAVRAGLQRILGSPELWILVLALGLSGIGAIPGAIGLLSFAGAYILVRALTGGAPLLAPVTAGTFASAGALAVVLGSSRRGGRESPDSARFAPGMLGPAWLVGALLGALFGGAVAVPVGFGPAEAWYSTMEAFRSETLSALGALAGVTVMAGAASGLHVALRDTRVAVGLSFLLGALATATLVATTPEMVAYFPWGVPGSAFQSGLLALVLGFALPTLGLRLGSAATLAFALLLATGSGIGSFTDMRAIPGSLVIGTTLAFGWLLWSGRRPGTGPTLILAATAATAAGWQIRAAIQPAGEWSIASAIGAGLVTIALFHVGTRLAAALPAGKTGRTTMAVGGLAAVVAVTWRLIDYRSWISEAMATTLSAGGVPLPLLSLTLLVLAVFLRPRRHRVAEQLGLAGRRRSHHLLAFLAAFLLLPFGNVIVPFPGSVGEMTGEEEAYRTVTSVLTSTYMAFNLEDENQLYEQLAMSVTEGLLPILYLDSRRRLTAGTAQDDQVTVQTVEVFPSGTVSREDGTDSTLRWTGQWVVTARIQHLEHMHERRNLYTGTLTLQLERDAWKLDAVELSGEDREVIPWSPT